MERLDCKDLAGGRDQLFLVVVAAAVEGEHLAAGQQRQAARADESPQVPDGLGRGGRVEPGAQRLGRQARRMQHVVGGPLRRGGDPAPAPQSQHGEDRGGKAADQRQHGECRRHGVDSAMR